MTPEGQHEANEQDQPKRTERSHRESRHEQAGHIAPKLAAVAENHMPKVAAKLAEMAEYPVKLPIDSQVAADVKRIADGIDSLVKLTAQVVNEWVRELERTRR